MGNTHTTRAVVVIGAVIAVVAFTGGYLVKGSKDDSDDASGSPSPTPSYAVYLTPSVTPLYSPRAYLVKLTSGGITPASLTIRVGDTVTFRNDAAVSFWPASNPHPTHTDCPGFDAMRALNNGESYTLAFTKVEQCGYHNHLDPSNPMMKGTITVR